MLILFGEKTVTSTENLGAFNCPVCATQKDLIRVVEKNYFTVFFIRILPLGITADYHQCSGCAHTYRPDSTEEPLYFSSVKFVLAYLLVGFGLEHGIGTSRKIFELITGADVSSAEMQSQINHIRQGTHLLESLKQEAQHLGWFDKSLVVEAAFLMVFAARPIEYEERLQINLVGNAMGVGLEGVNAIVKNLQSQQYKGIRSMEIGTYNPQNG